MTDPFDPDSHQWIFVTDTVDAVLPPEDWKPFALLDQMALELDDTRKTSQVEISTQPFPREVVTGSGKARKPLLLGLRHSLLTAVADLGPFFSSVSLASYESLYRGGGVDWSSIESGVCADLFDG